VEFPSNAVIGELLAVESDRTQDTFRRRALRRAARATLTWNAEVRDLVAQGEPLTTLPRVGPWVASEIERLSADAQDIRPNPLRAGFLTWTQVEPAAAHLLPRVKADLQTHTLWSDGHSTVLDMASAAQARGYSYLLITDHSKGLPIANGLDEDRMRVERAELEQVAAQLSFRLLWGIEMNLDLDGSGDMEPSLLDELDVILGAFHSSLRKRDDQTERYLAAVRNPWVDVLAHPRGRMYNIRIGLSADWPRVFEEAARLDKAIEVDGYADRQDIDLELLQSALDSGVRISLGSDSHHVVDLDYMTFSAGAVMLAGLPEERIINCMPADELVAWAHQHRRSQARRR
jgi:histidinol phosphatase-like PHP family hydrolase